MKECKPRLLIVQIHWMYEGGTHMSDPRDSQKLHLTSDRLAVILRDGSTVPTIDLPEIVMLLEEPEFNRLLQAILARRGGSENLKLVIEALDIERTSSAFLQNNPSLQVLENVAVQFPFSYWLTQMGIHLTAATRDHLVSWWEAFMLMGKEAGYNPHGHINDVGRAVNLWRATGALAEKMRDQAAAYHFMPPLLINHPQQVTRLLADLNEPEPFLEVLTGERIEDLRTSPTFLGAFSTSTNDAGAIVRDIPHAIFSVALVLKRR